MPFNTYNISEYDPEVSANFFEQLERSVGYVPDYKKVYNQYSRVFMKCLDNKTADNRLNFGGTFAKTDYVLKELHAPRSIVRMTNDTRVRLRKRVEMSDEELKEWYLRDLRNLCEFVAFVYSIEIPEALTSMFPTEKEEKHAPVLIGERLRVIIDRWDDDFVYGEAEESADGEEVKVCYSHGNKSYDFDWTYLRDMLYHGAQINVIRPREDNGVIYPELIIFEPDYLVDISTVAKCFTNYAESPLVNLVSKLQPNIPTEPTVLGNLASQLLDEEIHMLPNTRSYVDSVNEFWKNNAVGLLTAGIGAQFHSNAQLQKQNIAHAMRDVMPSKVSSYDPKEGMVEPSFFSEMLGLQGRMDYLQLDFKVLLEQKSGKGEFPYDRFIIPKYKEEHYVQMLLYMALIRYNYREIYEKNNKELSAFLLYSKYKESLIGLGFAPDLIFRAIKVRNGLAWMEMLNVNEERIRILDTLSPEKLNLNGVNNKLWTDYQYKQLSDALYPIQEASELEKEYYFRFLTFISNEHVLSKLGNKTKENSGFASKWYDSLEEKLQAGNIYDQLTLISPDEKTEGNVSRLCLRFNEDESNDMSNFRTGDIVILYAYEKGKEPDARKTMVFRCSIEDIKKDTIDLILRAEQSDKMVFLREKDKLWAIEHDFFESSYGSLYRGMHAFLSAPKSRRDLILLQRKPEVDASITLKGDYGNFNELSTRVKQAQDLFLIIGPPGTGKTSFGMLNTLKEELLEPESNVLLLSYTNRAVDEICSKLYEKDIDFIRVGGGLSCAETYRDKLLTTRAQNCQKMTDLVQVIQKTRVFVATTTAMNANINLFQLKKFSLAIIDEASQILEPHLIGLLSANDNGMPAIRKIVMIGDHKQLPAVVQQKEDVSRVDNRALNDILLTDCRLSLFERLLRKYHDDKSVTYMLTKQGRMHHDIALFPNYAFYNNQLDEVGLSHQSSTLDYESKGKDGIRDILTTRRICFINAELPKEGLSDKVNQVEADIIVATILKIYEIEKEDFDIDQTIGVIVPYRNQIATVRNCLDKAGIDILHGITIDTVERYQGSQRKYIIYGFTIQQYYQLNFLTNNVFTDWNGDIIDRKLNVAMTRAMEHLIMVGNAELLSNNFTFFKLMEFVKSKHSYFDIPLDRYVSGDFPVLSYDPHDLDLSKGTFTTSADFDRAFDKIILSPLKEASGETWPERVLGYDMLTNLNAIGYGRTNFASELQMFDGKVMSSEEQALLYCYYMMQQHYCSGISIYRGLYEWLKNDIESVNGRLQFIDIGCGSANCGIAFSEVFNETFPYMVYTGVDTSAEMRAIGKAMMDEAFSDKAHMQMVESFGSLGRSFWDGCSELPSMVVFNFSYFFSNISAMQAEQLARQIASIMKRYTLNKYVIIIQHSDTDNSLNAYKVFRHILAPYVSVIKDEKNCFSYELNHSEKQMDFCYCVMCK